MGRAGVAQMSELANILARRRRMSDITKRVEAGKEEEEEKSQCFLGTVEEEGGPGEGLAHAVSNRATIPRGKGRGRRRSSRSLRQLSLGGGGGGMAELIALDEECRANEETVELNSGEDSGDAADADGGNTAVACPPPRGAPPSGPSHNGPPPSTTSPARATPRGPPRGPPPPGQLRARDPPARGPPPSGPPPRAAGSASARFRARVSASKGEVAARQPPERTSNAATAATTTSTDEGKHQEWSGGNGPSESASLEDRGRSSSTSSWMASPEYSAVKSSWLDDRNGEEGKDDGLDGKEGTAVTEGILETLRSIADGGTEGKEGTHATEGTEGKEGKEGKEAKSSTPDEAASSTDGKDASDEREENKASSMEGDGNLETNGSESRGASGVEEERREDGAREGARGSSAEATEPTGTDASVGDEIRPGIKRGSSRVPKRQEDVYTSYSTTPPDTAKSESSHVRPPGDATGSARGVNGASGASGGGRSTELRSEAERLREEVKLLREVAELRNQVFTLRADTDEPLKTAAAQNGKSVYSEPLVQGAMEDDSWTAHSRSDELSPLQHSGGGANGVVRGRGRKGTLDSDQGEVVRDPKHERRRQLQEHLEREAGMGAEALDGESDHTQRSTHTNDSNDSDDGEKDEDSAELQKNIGAKRDKDDGGAKSDDCDAAQVATSTGEPRPCRPSASTSTRRSIAHSVTRLLDHTAARKARATRRAMQRASRPSCWGNLQYCFPSKCAACICPRQSLDSRGVAEELLFHRIVACLWLHLAMGVVFLFFATITVVYFSSYVQFSNTNYGLPLNALFFVKTATTLCVTGAIFRNTDGAALLAQCNIRRSRHDPIIVVEVTWVHMVCVVRAVDLLIGWWTLLACAGSFNMNTARSSSAIGTVEFFVVVALLLTDIWSAVLEFGIWRIVQVCRTRGHNMVKDGQVLSARARSGHDAVSEIELLNIQGDHASPGRAMGSLEYGEGDDDGRGGNAGMSNVPGGATVVPKLNLSGIQSDAGGAAASSLGSMVPRLNLAALAGAAEDQEDQADDVIYIDTPADAAANNNQPHPQFDRQFDPHHHHSDPYSHPHPYHPHPYPQQGAPAGPILPNAWPLMAIEKLSTEASDVHPAEYQDIWVRLPVAWSASVPLDGTHIRSDWLAQALSQRRFWVVAHGTTVATKTYAFAREWGWPSLGLVEAVADHAAFHVTLKVQNAQQLALFQTAFHFEGIVTELRRHIHDQQQWRQQQNRQGHRK